MSELPPGMYQGTRPPVHPHFDKDEYLYRRVPHFLWDEDADGFPIGVDAIELPDMSVMRSQFAHPEWARLPEGCEDWAVVGFKIQGIPPDGWIDGIKYLFRAVHRPDRKNYPHTEVWAFEAENEGHVDGKKVMLPETVHLKWREILLRAVEIFLRAYQMIAIRQHNPLSYKPEAIPVA